MKKIISFAIAALTFAAVSCSKHEGGIEAPVYKTTLEVNAEQDTKLALEGLKVTFAIGDSIAVWDGTAIQRFKCIASNGSNATFQGELTVGATQLYSVFPYTSMKKVENGKISTFINSTQEVEEGCNMCPGALVGVAKSAVGAPLNFKTISSLLAVKVDRDNVDKIVVRSIVSKEIVGNTTVDPDGVDTTNFGGSSSIVTFKAKTGTLTKDQTYYVAILPCTMEGGLGIAASQGDLVGFKGNKKSCVFARKSISKINMSDFSWATFGTPELINGPIYQNKELVAKVRVPYTGCTKATNIFATCSLSGDGKGELGVSGAVDIAAGDGSYEIPLTGSATTLGSLTISPRINGLTIGNKSETRVEEKLPYTNFVAWNFWAKGYTRSDFNYVRGSKWDESWTSEAVNATTSGNTSDHKIWASHSSSEANEKAFLSVVSSKSIVAGGKTTGPKSDPTGLAGYQFNPGIQIKGMGKDDYFIATIPAVKLSAQDNITVHSACGGAKAAANCWIFEYSTDNSNWTQFDGSKTVTVSSTDYAYHMWYVTTYESRYIYSRDNTKDQTHCTATAIVASAIDGPLYVRLRASGLNGDSKKKAVDATGGWGDIKFLEVAFNDVIIID